MSLIVSDKELEAVIKLDGHVRYEYFVKRVADWREAWGLFAEDGWLSAEDDDGRACFPLWPARRYADACREAEWSDGESRVITLDYLVDHLLPGLHTERKLVTVFPVPGRFQSLHPDPLQLRADLLAEYRKMHDDRD